MIGLSQIQKSFNKYVAPALLTVFFLSEAYGKFANRYFYDKSDLAKYIKFVLLLFLIVTCLKYLKQVKHIGLLIIVFLLGQLTISHAFQNEIIIVFAKFLFPLFLFLYFNNISELAGHKGTLFKTFETLMVLNSFLIFIGYIFDISLFNTYSGQRFGFNGLFLAVSTGSYAYIITLLYFLLTYKENAVKNWKFILIFISCIFIGTKAVYLAMAFSLGYLIVVSKIPYKKVALSCVVFLGFGVAYYFFFHYDLFNTIRQSDGMLSALLSYRDQLFLEKTLPFIQESWGWVNYLFGGVSDFDLRSQMDIIDVFFFWGIVGGAFYLYVFFKLFLPDTLNKTAFVFIAFLFFIVLLSGNFFVYSFVALFLLVLKLKLEEASRIDLEEF